MFKEQCPLWGVQERISPPEEDIAGIESCFLGVHWCNHWGWSMDEGGFMGILMNILEYVGL